MVRRGGRAGARTDSMQQATTVPLRCGGRLPYLLGPVAAEGWMFSLDYLCQGRRVYHSGDSRNPWLGTPPMSGL